jgi:hypothetical protein
MFEGETGQAEKTDHDDCDTVGSGLQSSAGATMLPVKCLWPYGIQCAVSDLGDVYYRPHARVDSDSQSRRTYRQYSTPIADWRF